jgi:hypothetical protein
VREIVQRAPDVVLLDVHLPGGGGVEILRRLAVEAPGARCLALSVSDDPEDVIAVIRAGARGYVTKTISPVELADAIRRVQEDDAVFSPRLAGFVLDAFAAGAGGGGSGTGVGTGGLLVGPRPAHPARARGPAPHRPRLPLQGDRPAAGDLGQDRRGPRQRRPAQAPALHAARAEPLGGGATTRRLNG